MSDVFSDLLSLMSAQSVVSGGLVTGGKWAISFPPSEKLKFWGILRGDCWLLMDGRDAAIRVTPGDVFLLCSPRCHVLATDLGLAPVPLTQVLEHRVGAVASHGEGTDFFMVGGKVELDDAHGALLLNSLPSMIHVRASSRHAETLGWLLNQLVSEQEQSPGSHVASTQLAHLMFIHILRAHFEGNETLEPGWVRAATDKRVGPVLRQVHRNPGKAWKLGELAQACAMSRASFASYFKAISGVSPMAYLTQWRMRLAMQALRRGCVSVGALADSLGYASESAFSHAFKRVVGRSPKSYRDEGSHYSGSRR
jgi:AraC-like DNA-binding protein